MLPVSARLIRRVSAPPAPFPHGYRLARPDSGAPVEVRAAETSWSIRLHSRWFGTYQGDEAVGQTPAATTLRPASPAAGPPRPASDHIPTAPELPSPTARRLPGCPPGLAATCHPYPRPALHDELSRCCVKEFCLE